ncbi:MAG: bL21 family ribosomal protein [Rectinema sp.]|nr:bL21 family ribosomal protein [Rectinema sp.]
MYAVVEINGKQYRAEKGKKLTVDRFDAQPGQQVVFDKVVVFKYIPKKDYRRTHGHRQAYTVVTVDEIIGA